MKKDLHEVAGLVRAGLDVDGEQEWIGTKKQWNDYERISEAEPDEAKDEALNDTRP